ncbi:PP2C family protein-serine/threonine phosphatase [Nocardia sp. NPDC048505]|uniref:PP2C family protein-serine/threonine phosphatase n=1 Tax=unclassified Nocardia TaxID=2637762 RepID=UPI0033E28E71
MEQPSWSARIHEWWMHLHLGAPDIADMVTALSEQPGVLAAFALGAGTVGNLWADEHGLRACPPETALRLHRAAAAGELVELELDADRVVLASCAQGSGDPAVVGVLTAAPTPPEVIAEVRQVRDIAAAAGNRQADHRERTAREVQDAILAEASLRMSSSLDIDETLRAIVRMVVPAIADGAAVHVARNGMLEPVAVAHVDARREHRLAEYLREGRWSGGVAEDELEPAGLPEDTNLETAATTVLRAHGREVGLLSVFQRPRSRRRFTTEFMRNLAGRAASAIDNAALHDRQRRDMLMLQQHLLPATLPAVPGVEIATAYRVAEHTLEVGGDFYGAVLGPDERLHGLIGDVCGRGAAAAALTGLARHTIETLLTAGHTVPRALHALNAKMLRDNITRFLTLAVVSLRADPGGTSCEVEIHTAGHPRPLVARADGTVEEADCSGLLIGYKPDLLLVPTTVRLRPGDGLLLYTDGLSEARDEAGRFFEPELSDSLARLRDLPPARVTDILTSGDGRFRVHDDTAVVFLRYLGTASNPAASNGVSPWSD